MKKVIMVTVVAACIGLCAAVWLQSNVVEETSAMILTPAVSAPEATVADLKKEIESAPLAEKEKEVAQQTEVLQEVPPEPEPVAMETTVAPEAPKTPELETTSDVEHEPTPEPIPGPTEEQTTDTPQSGDMVYVPGFGWMESQGPNQVDYAEDMYENGNKIGDMG